MWITKDWQDYELLDCGGGEKLERWDQQILVRPDPQAIWDTDRRDRRWKTANARYSRSSTGGGHWDKGKLPESWPIRYKDLTFQGCFRSRLPTGTSPWSRSARRAAPFGC